MSTTPLIPQSFWFRLEFGCRRLPDVPRAETSQRLLDLDASCALPGVSRLEGREPWADLRVAWNDGGLAVSVHVSGKLSPVRAPDPEEPDHTEGVQLWIDTRDTRDIHRASRHCHRFQVSLQPKASGKGLGCTVTPRTINRAVANAPLAKSGSILHRADALKDGWRLELFFKAEALNGFDPETNRRLGFMIQVTDLDRGDQFLGVGREFPVTEDPSLWPTLVLLDR